MTDELMILSGLDQSLSITEDDLLEQIDFAVQEGIRQKNALIPLNAAKKLIEITQLAGLGLAKIFYLINENWDKFGIDGEFDEIAYEYLGKHAHTVERYVKVWRMFAENIAPEELQQRNIGELIPIGNAVAQGYEITDEQWEKLSQAEDRRAISRIVRDDIKGAAPRKNALQLSMDDDGGIKVTKGGKIGFAGHLYIYSDDPMILEAVARIIDNSGIMS